MRQFPRRQRGSLVAGPRLVDPHVERDSGIESFVNGCQRSSPIDCRQPSGVAMGKDLKWSLATQAIPDLAKQNQSMLAQNRAIFGILIRDRESLAIGRVMAFRGGE